MEPLSVTFSPRWLYDLFRAHNRMVKSMLLDQQFIAGLGNIYIDEVLWHSQIHPKAISSNVGRKKIIFG